MTTSNRPKVKVPTDYQAFQAAAATLVRHLPGSVTASATQLQDYPYLIMKTVGCVGNLRDWLYRSAMDALVNNDGILDDEILERNPLDVHKLMELLNEAETGEKLLKDLPEDDLAARYGFERLRGNLEPALQRGRIGRRKGNQKPGKRLPSKDPVGGLSAGA